MSSTFFGFNTAKSGLNYSQRALYVVSHNMSNLNTQGYSRQRVDAHQSHAYRLPQGYGFLGSGVDSDYVRQIRNTFLDDRIRREFMAQGEWEARADVLSHVESIFNEPSNSSIGTTLNEFFSSLNELNKHPESQTVRALVRERGIALSRSFELLHKNLVKLQDEVEFNTKAVVNQINDYGEQIKLLNKNIYALELDGTSANDLRDQRNLLVDKLSKLVNVNYHEDELGRFHININGHPLVSHFDNSKLTTKTRDVRVNPYDSLYLSDIKWEDGAEFEPKSGEIKALMDLRDSADGGKKGIPFYLEEINRYSDRFATELNRIHMEGYGLNGTHNVMMFTMDNMTSFEYEQYLRHSGFEGKPPMDVTDQVTKGLDPSFTTKKNDEIRAENIRNLLNNNPQYRNKSVKMLSDGKFYLTDRIPANRMTLAKDLDRDQNKFAASSTLNGVPGNAENALRMSDMRSNVYMFSMGSPDDYVKSMVSNLGVDSNESKRMVQNLKVLTKDLENKRQSVMGVSQDEEVADMIRFQHAYNANARMLTTMDEMIDTIIHRLGLVGR